MRVYFFGNNIFPAGFVICLEFKHQQMHKISLYSILSIIIPLSLNAQEPINYWPKQMELDGYVLTIYAPEPENFENNVLEARAAFSLFDKSHLPIFGAMWFRCFVHTDVKNNEVYFEDIQLVNANFPEVKAEDIQQLQRIISESSQQWSLNSNLSTFYKNLGSLEINNASSEALINHPPKILYSNVPAALVYIDGDPILEAAKNAPLYSYVVNTPHFIVQSMSDKQYYLKISNWWYVAADPKASWKAIETPPAAILQLAAGAARTESDEKNEAGRQPKLIITDEPAELIQTAGPPEIAQGYENLFVISNSEDEIIFDSYKDEYYILISGRWFKTRRLESAVWKFVAPNELPTAFSEIPPSSPLAHIRMSVAGTPEAMSAALNNGIPQTALIDRHSATMNAQYDGTPIFEDIDGTSLRYAVNTPASILMDTDGMYYAVDQAIWFISNTPVGPWEVATTYPKEVRNIPPSCPLFNVKYVSIYDASDDIVFAGYTPGYMGTFLYRGVVYFGTGYRYKSWHGSKYFPTPSTYGSGAKKKKSNVTVTVSVGYGYGYPGMMYPGYGYGYGYGGYWGGYGYNSMFSKTETVSFNDEAPTEKPIDLVNIYNNRKLGIVNTETARRNDPMKPVILPDNSETAPFHMFADSDGNLYRQDQNGATYQRKDNDWQLTDK
jgi:hypothetical protein